MGTIGYPQLKFLRTSCDDDEALLRSLLAAEVSVFTLSKTVLPCDQERTSGFWHEQTLLEELVKTYEGAQFAEVEIVETRELTHPGLHHRHYDEALCCLVSDITTLPICTFHIFN